MVTFLTLRFWDSTKPQWHTISTNEEKNSGEFTLTIAGILRLLMQVVTVEPRKASEVLQASLASVSYESIIRHQKKSFYWATLPKTKHVSEEGKSMNHHFICIPNF